MTDVRLQTSIEKAFEDRAKITASTKGEARNAVEEALDLLDRGKARVAEKLPGLVILDLMLPKVSGFDLLAEWYANPRTSELPVFILTNKDLSAEEESYIRAHAESLVKKQVHWKDTLLAQIRRMLEQRGRHSEFPSEAHQQTPGFTNPV